MQLPSFSLILSGVFITYISYSIYTVSLLFTPPLCTSEKYCSESYLNQNPKLQLNLFISTMSRPLQAEVMKIFTNTEFDYKHDQDMYVYVYI
jgi:hypothetical protein